jgi:hypothetical protein
MTFLIARIDAAITRIGNKLCNALDASLYHDWDLEDTPNDGAHPLADDDLGPLPCRGGIVGHSWRCPKHAQCRGQIDRADPLAEREAEEEVAGTPPTHPPLANGN